MVLKKGSVGPQVVTLQQRLRELGLYSGKIDGDFGTATRKAVIAFQNSHNLKPDGEVGPDTLTALQLVLPTSAGGGVLSANSLGDLVGIPAGINPGLTRALQSTMIEVLGVPGSLTENCSPLTNAHIKALVVTQSVGPFSVTGLKPAVEGVARVFAKVQLEKPELHAHVRTPGMLCCRRVRRKPGQTPSKNFSNHSWGTAIDLQFGPRLDNVGDGLTQLGLLQLAPFFNDELFYWGAGFQSTAEDAMHFEASDELVRRWASDRLI